MPAAFLKPPVPHALDLRCKYLVHYQKLPEEAVWMGLLKEARYVALLHRQEGWQDRAASTVLLGTRLILYNMTEPHQPYRYLCDSSAFRATHILKWQRLKAALWLC
jgi:hypothetical protein